MRRAPITAAAVAAALAVPATGAAAHAPAGIPDLAKMAVAPADLPHGASMEGEGYLTLKGTAGAYFRAFAFSRGAARRTGVDALASDVWLFKTPADGATEFAGLRQLLRDTKLGRQYTRFIAEASGMSVRRVRVGHQRAMALADGAFVLRTTVTTRHRKVGMAFGVLVRDRVVTQVTAFGRPRGARMMRLTRSALRASGEHIQVGLSPVSTSPPAISGTATLHATTGSWSPATKPDAFAYQWERCDANGAACVAIPGATQPDYVVAATDKGSTLRVAVTASNAVGRTTAVSAATAAVS